MADPAFTLPLTPPPSLTLVLPVHCVLSSEHGRCHGFQQSASNLPLKPLSLLGYSRRSERCGFIPTNFHLSAFLCILGRPIMPTSSAVLWPPRCILLSSSDLQSRWHRPPTATPAPVFHPTANAVYPRTLTLGPAGPLQIFYQSSEGDQESGNT